MKRLSGCDETIDPDFDDVPIDDLLRGAAGMDETCWSSPATTLTTTGWSNREPWFYIHPPQPKKGRERQRFAGLGCKNGSAYFAAHCQPWPSAGQLARIVNQSNPEFDNLVVRIEAVGWRDIEFVHKGVEKIVAITSCRPVDDA